MRTDPTEPHRGDRRGAPGSSGERIEVALFDYGAGNLHSLAKALERGGARVRVETDPAAILDADATVLPGVGAFGPAAAALAPAAADIRRRLEDGYPCLGICLGMQLLFEESEEADGRGLGLFPGRVTRLRARRVPQMGWNEVVAEPGRPDSPAGRDPLLPESGSLYAYYANSYVPRPAEPRDVIAWTTYEDDRFAAAVRRQRTCGLQFHPEKSSAPGLRLIGAFLEEARAR